MRMLAYCCGLVTLLLAVPLASGVPWDPKVSARQEKLATYEHRSYSHTFAAGQRALAIVTGTGASFLGLYVYDGDGNCVARDDGVTLNIKDDMAAQWLPPRTAVYTVEIRNLGRVENTCLLAIRQDKAE